MPATVRNEHSLVPAPLRAPVLAWTAGWPPDRSASWLADQGLLGVAFDPAFPEAVRSRLSPHAERTEVRNRLLVWRFQDVVDALAPRPVCALKGIALLDSAYGSRLGARPMVDIDLLLRPADMEPALSVLRAELGLRETSLSGRLHERVRHRVLTAGDVKVELHRSLSLGRPSNWDDLRPVPARVHGRDAHVLDVETQLVHLAAHLVTHVPFSRLKWVADLLHAACAPHDGRRVWRRARELGASRTVLAASDALRLVLGEPAPIDLPAGSWSDRLAVEAHRRLVWRALEPGRLDAGAAASRLERLATSVLLSDTTAAALGTFIAKLRELAARRGA